jgi:hypothetical protein
MSKESPVAVMEEWADLVASRPLTDAERLILSERIRDMIDALKTVEALERVARAADRVLQRWSVAQLAEDETDLVDAITALNRLRK